MYAVSFIFFCALASCASAPPPPPEWALRGVDAVWPSDAYIAEEGRGKTKTQAEADALAALSRFFLSEVSTTARSSSSWTSAGTGSGGSVSRSEHLETDTFVRSNTRLFAVRYAAPWYNPRDKEYTTAAWLNREEAWAVFAPRVQQEADGFRALWRQAETESSALKIFFAYRAVQRYTSRPGYENTMSFGEVLHPAKMTLLVRDVREQSAQLAAKINGARNMASVFIDCPKDADSAVSGTLARLLSGEGLIIASAKNSAQAVCTVTIDEGYQNLEAGYFYTPRISIVINDKKGTALFSYAASAGREGALNPAVAKRRAYLSLTAALERSFIEEFNRTFDR